MSGDYGPKTVYRTIKADILSLTSFEIGLFGWMAIFQIGIIDWQLEMNTVTYLVLYLVSGDRAALKDVYSLFKSLD